MTPFELDMALQAPVFYMMQRGILVDREKQGELLKEQRMKWDKYQTMLDEVVGFHLNVNSPKQVATLLYNVFRLPVRKVDGKPTTNEDAIRAMMATVEHEWRSKVQEEAQLRWGQIFLTLKLILMIRGIRKEISSYLDIELDADNRARCLMAVGGTETMRFSHSKTLRDTGLNLATVPKRLRSIFIADDGYELAEFDLNRGESWVYSFLSMDPELIRIHTTGGDFHSETAEAIQSVFEKDPTKRLTWSQIKAGEKSGDQHCFKLRYTGKRVNHASAYRMGPHKGAEVINEESDDTHITITPSQMATAQALWRAKYKGIQGWWDSIDRQLNESRTLITPYGRVRTFYGFLSDHLKKEATASVPQSTSVDYINRGMLRVYNKMVKKNALELLHQNHDSIVIQYPQNHRNEIIPEVIEQLTSEPVFINGHPVIIPVEGMYGHDWKNLTEWKG